MTGTAGTPELWAALAQQTQTCFLLGRITLTWSTKHILTQSLMLPVEQVGIASNTALLISIARQAMLPLF